MRKPDSLLQNSIFHFKKTLLQMRRAFQNYFSTSPRFQLSQNKLNSAFVIAESVTALWTETQDSEWKLQMGKVQNLRVLANRLNGLEIPANQTFSFWRQIGKPSQHKGFVIGRELRQGCLIPTLAGGICQMSNALYDAALKANFEIVERHAHSQVIPHSLAEQGRDATVFWNYVDLRFRAQHSFRIEVELDREDLRIRFKGVVRPAHHVPLHQNGHGEPVEPLTSQSIPQSCASCGKEDCSKNVEKTSLVKKQKKTAFLVDEYWPEFDSYIQKQRRSQDLFFIPLDGKKYKKQNYKWNCSGFAKVKSQFFFTLKRSFISRKLSDQGAQRQRALMNFQEELAKRYAKQIPYDVDHLVITQNLLPYLWKSGELGGRTFDVLMTRLAWKQLQKTLDEAALKYPDSKTLKDFRLEQEWLVLEEQALAAARFCISPHSQIQKMYPSKMIKLDWQLPKTNTASMQKLGERYIFPAAALGRKGAYEVREVFRELQIPLYTFVKNFEGKDFWSGVKIQKLEDDWLKEAKVVLFFSYLESRPHKLLEALSRGIPVIASSACGLENLKNVESVNSKDELLQKIILHSTPQFHQACL